MRVCLFFLAFLTVTIKTNVLWDKTNSFSDKQGIFFMRGFGRESNDDIHYYVPDLTRFVGVVEVARIFLSLAHPSSVMNCRY